MWRIAYLPGELGFTISASISLSNLRLLVPKSRSAMYTQTSLVKPQVRAYRFTMVILPNVVEASLLSWAVYVRCSVTASKLYSAVNGLATK